jgi:hypothetical protein
VFGAALSPSEFDAGRSLVRRPIPEDAAFFSSPPIKNDYNLNDHTGRNVLFDVAKTWPRGKQAKLGQPAMHCQAQCRFLQALLDATSTIVVSKKDGVSNRDK